MKAIWTVHVTDTAAQDFSGILLWTAEQFGDAQARVYEETLLRAIEALTAGPDIAGVRAHNELFPGLLLLHVARQRRKGRHVLAFRKMRGRENEIEVLRILHDAMDVARHMPSREPR